jgi:tetratricopeptide (TPR) repeat protein|tara:strand:- start:909 stop:1814 length:906 start_codon:yes stop_codon:yes gene_type:complete
MAAKWQKTLDDLLYNGDLDGAYNLLDGILRENSGDLQARLAFGRVQYELGDPDNARNTFETVLKNSPRNSEALKGKAEVCELLGEYEEAIRSYHLATQAKPKDIEGWKLMGILLTKLKKFGKADKCWNAILRLNARDAEAWYNKGYAKMLVQKYDDAEKCLKKAIQFKSDMKEAHNDLVMVLRKKGDHKGALIVCNHALKSHDADDTLHRNKGNILYALDRPEEALKAFDYALELNPYVVDTWVNKGTVLWKAMEMRDEALSAFDKALEINPHFMAAVDSRINLEAEIKANKPSFFKRIFG